MFRYFLPKRVSAIALWPFIFIKEKELSKNPILINHEKIHLKQQVELLILLFYCFYLIEYLFLLFRFLNHDKAYRNISFEKEAYQNDKDLNYINTRKLWAMWRK